MHVRVDKAEMMDETNTAAMHTFWAKLGAIATLAKHDAVLVAAVAGVEHLVALGAPKAHLVVDPIRGTHQLLGKVDRLGACRALVAAAAECARCR